MLRSASPQEGCRRVAALDCGTDDSAAPMVLTVRFCLPREGDAGTQRDGAPVATAGAWLSGEAVRPCQAAGCMGAEPLSRLRLSQMAWRKLAMAALTPCSGYLFQKPAHLETAKRPLSGNSPTWRSPKGHFLENRPPGDRQKATFWKPAHLEATIRPLSGNPPTWRPR